MIKPYVYEPLVSRVPKRGNKTNVYGICTPHLCDLFATTTLDAGILPTFTLLCRASNMSIRLCLPAVHVV